MSATAALVAEYRRRGHVTVPILFGALVDDDDAFVATS